MAKVLILLIVSLSFSFLSYSPVQNFEISFLNIGQGDSTVIRTFDNKIVLIDTGNSTSLLDELDLILYPRKIIDLLIISHFDSDHYGEILNLIKYYEIKQIILPPLNKESKSLENLKVAISENNIKNLTPLSGAKIMIDNYSSIEFIWPLNLEQFFEISSNDASISFVLTVNQFKAFFGGDLSSYYENKLSNVIGDVDLLKVSHHGSRYSTSKEFVETLNPEVSIISSGKNNSYGHPSNDVLSILNNSKVLRTDEFGTIKVSIGKQSYSIFSETYFTLIGEISLKTAQKSGYNQTF